MIVARVANVCCWSFDGVFYDVFESSNEHFKEFVSSEVIVLDYVPLISIFVLIARVAHSIWWICKHHTCFFSFFEYVREVCRAISAIEYVFSELVDVSWLHKYVLFFVQGWHFVLYLVWIFFLVWDPKSYFIKIKHIADDWELHF